MTFLFLHGLEGSDDGHWQRWLAARLQAAGERVRFPDLPDAGDPEPATWEAALREELDLLDEPPVVLCHSLACLLWLRHAGASEGPQAERVLLVAPPHREDIRPVHEFSLFTPDPAAVASAAVATRIVCSDDDPYCPGGAAEVYARPLGIEHDLVPGGAHLNLDAGFGPWPGAEDWALGLSRVVR